MGLEDDLAGIKSIRSEARQIKLDTAEIRSEMGDVKSTVNSISSNQLGFGAFCLIALGTLYSCNSSDKASDIKRELSYVKTKVESIQSKQADYVLKTENVVGNEAPDVFIEFGDQKYFLEVDGRKVNDYIPAPTGINYQPQVPR